MSFLTSARALLRGIANSTHKGLAGKADVRFGNNVSFSKRRTRRRWKLNFHRRTFYSDILERPVSIRVTSRVLHTIDRLGSFDAYVLLTKDSSLVSKRGLSLKRSMEEKLFAQTGETPGSILWKNRQALLANNLENGGPGRFDVSRRPPPERHERRHKRRARAARKRAARGEAEKKQVSTMYASQSWKELVGRYEERESELAQLGWKSLPDMTS